MIKNVLWALFRNDDEHPNPPRWYCPTQPLWWRHIKWWGRNPFHNLTFYVLGCAGKTFERKAVYPKEAPGNLVFRDEGGWYIAVIWSGLIKKFYIGWRERGNLGAKLTIKN